MKWRLILIGAIYLVSSRSAFGFEIAPEYRGLEINETTAFDNPAKIDAEYQSDYLAFTPRLRELNPRRRISFNAGAGSLGAKDFMVRNDLKLSAPLESNFEFRLRHFYSSDLEEKTKHNFYEFVKWSRENHQTGIALYGEVFGEKSEIDVGAAFLHKGQRFYFTAPDFQRNKRNHFLDRFKTPPYVIGYQKMRLLGDTGFDQLDLRYETPTEWDFIATNDRYKFSRSYVGYMRHDDGKNLRAEYINKFESNNSGSWRSERFLLDASVEESVFEAGIMFSHRQWRTNEEITKQYYQPYLWWSFQPHWRLGGEITRTEGRLNVEWGRPISNDGLLVALLSFDADNLSQAWEGGSLRMSLGF